MVGVEDGKVSQEQVQPRWPWFAAAALLFGSAALTAVSVRLHWIPCRGSMLDGTAFAPPVTADLSTACLRRMDAGLPFPFPPEIAERAPWASELGGLAVASAISAWILLVLGLRLRTETLRIALSAAVVPMITAVVGLFTALDRRPESDSYTLGLLWLAGDLIAVVVLCVLWGRNTELTNKDLLGLAVVLWGATAFGMMHDIPQFVVMTGFNENNWDTPPGTGWITVAALFVAAATAVWFGARRRSSPVRVLTTLPS